MTDSDLQALFARLTAVRISHGDDRLWNSEVKRLVAEETQLELTDHFNACDRDYLNLHTKAELAELALAAGITVDVTVLKKSAAIDYLSRSARLVGYVPERLLPLAGDSSTSYSGCESPEL